MSVAQSQFSRKQKLYLKAKSYTMKAQIVSPEKVLYDGEAKMVVCRTVNGDVAFLDDHEPFLGMLKAGEIRIVNDNQEIAFECTRGFVEVDGSQVRIISDDAVAK